MGTCLTSCSILVFINHFFLNLQVRRVIRYVRSSRLQQNWGEEEWRQERERRDQKYARRKGSRPKAASAGRSSTETAEEW